MSVSRYRPDLSGLWLRWRLSQGFYSSGILVIYQLFVIAGSSGFKKFQTLERCNERGIG